MQEALLGEFEQIVMLAVLRLDCEAYGVSIAKEILACTRRTVSPGALYTTLSRLEKKQLLHSRQGPSTPERGGRAKRLYTVTPIGRNLLKTAQRNFQQLLNGLDLLGEAHG